MGRRRKGVRHEGGTSATASSASASKKRPAPRPAQGQTAAKKCAIRRSSRKRKAPEGDLPGSPPPRAARVAGERARRRLQSDMNEAACVSRNLDVLGPCGVVKWREAVATCYLLGQYSDTVLSEPAHPREWDRVGGTVAQVRKYMKVTKGSTESVRKIMGEAYLCYCEGESYSGRQASAGGHNKLIERSSPEERIAADAIENRLGYKVATELVNIYRVHEGKWAYQPHDAPPQLTALCAGKTPVGRSAVYSAILRLIDDGLGETVKPKKRKQGDFDPNSKWARASFAWAAQLLVMLGQISPSS